MVRTATQARIQVYKRTDQGTGGFDGGRITEFKPVGFPGDGATVKRVGPLFYWAWATAHEKAIIGLHPHRAFEIMSYVLEGEMLHRDTLGTESLVRAGGAQVMQTGSGVSHEEGLEGPGDFFQVWFEPDLAEAMKRQPTYNEFQDEAFRVTEGDGIKIKHLIGDKGPVELVTDAVWDDVTLDVGSRFDRELGTGRSLAVVVVEGEGFVEGGGGGPQPLELGDFVVAEGLGGRGVSFSADQESVLRLAVIEVPSEVDYPLHQK